VATGGAPHPEPSADSSAEAAAAPRLTGPEVEAAHDWYEAEPPLGAIMVEDLRRLKFRAKARWLLLIVLALGLTVAVVVKIARKPPLHIARVVLALSEGEVSQRNAPLPMNDLRAYVTTVLMPASELTKVIEKRDLFPLRKKQGPEFALGELWDIVEIEVFRNYFLFEQRDLGEERTARIAITVTWGDPDEAYEIAHDIAGVITRSAEAERDRAATIIAAEAARALQAAYGRAADIEAQIARLNSERARAESYGQEGKAAALRVEVLSLEGSLKRAREVLSTMARSGSTDQLLAAVYEAGLGFNIEVVEDRRPEPLPPRGYRTAMLAVVVFVVMVIVVALFLGAFDSRIHDLDDIARLGIPIVGQVPGFPGDNVGSLRQRGIKRRRQRGAPWGRVPWSGR
jgi:hypothetical protein